jgi:hypothetical protein
MTRSFFLVVLFFLFVFLDADDEQLQPWRLSSTGVPTESIYISTFNLGKFFFSFFYLTIN